MEVIIAIFMVAMGSAAATSLIVSAMHSNNFSRDNLVALNLATEGMEAMRNVRDTNWLKFGYDKENCWNLRPGMPPGTDCNDADKLIFPDAYAINLNPQNYSWELSENVGVNLDLNEDEPTNEDFRLAYIDVTPGDSDGDGNNANDQDLFVTKDFIADLGLISTGDSIFYRMVETSYYGENREDADRMQVHSLVQWRSSGIVHQVSLKTTLSNYLGT